MKVFFALASLLVSFSAFAIPPEAGFESALKLPNGDIQLIFAISTMGINGNNQVLVDDDGVATLATIQNLLIQGPQEDLYYQRKKWDELQNESVKDWAIVKPVVRYAMNKLQEAFKTYVVQFPKMVQMSTEFSPLVEKLEALGDRAPTYLELNELMGNWLKENAQKFKYNGVKLVENNSGNPIGSVLAGRGFVLSTEMVLSRSRADLKVDMAKAFGGCDFNLQK